MTITRTLITFLALHFSFAGLFGQSNISAFTIEGKVQGYSNGTKLYLNDLSDGSYKQVDSTVISNGKFIFKGKLKTKYLKSNISTTDFEDRATFWLESGIISFSADKGNFNKAVIKGSKIQDEQQKLNKLLDTAKNRQLAEYLFVKNNPNSIISAYTLNVYSKSWNRDTVSVLYHSFSKDIKSTTYGERILEFLTLNRNIKIGDKFVDFMQKDTADKDIRLSDLKGKVVLLEFWGSWCGPCREENPSLVKIYNDFKPMGFEIFGVAAETDKRQWIKAIKADGLT
ncbi:MAG: TlpA disulfide reductase family protein, partial [Chitinophagaceae bacterium]